MIPPPYTKHSPTSPGIPHSNEIPGFLAYAGSNCNCDVSLRPIMYKPRRIGYKIINTGAQHLTYGGNLTTARSLSPTTWNDHQLQNREAFAGTTRALEGVSPERTASFSTGRTRNSPRTTRTKHANTTGLVRLSLVAILVMSNTGALMDNMYVGYCKRGDKCWFLHVDGSEEPSPPGCDAECIICYDKPVTYGLMGASQRIIQGNCISDNRLDGCSHVLCVQVRITSRTPPMFRHSDSDFHLHHAVHSTVASPEQQNRRCRND